MSNSIDKMLVSDRSKRSLNRRPARFNGFVVGNEPSGVCPKCKQYVGSGCKGVLCSGCQAYWHYECAGVSDEILQNEWDGIDFQCNDHKSAGVNIPKIDNSKNIDQLFSDVRIKGFTLNIKEKLKEKLQNISSALHIEKLDGGRQYGVKLNTVSYQMIAQNMLTLGNQLGGVEVRNNDVDMNGTGIQCQYIVVVCQELSASITCYHTKSSMLVQMIGKKSVRKVEKLQQFMNGSFTGLVVSIEKFPKYPLLQEKMKRDIEDEIGGLELRIPLQDGGVVSKELVEFPLVVNNFINHEITSYDTVVVEEVNSNDVSCGLVDVAVHESVCEVVEATTGSQYGRETDDVTEIVTDTLALNPNLISEDGRTESCVLFENKSLCRKSEVKLDIEHPTFSSDVICDGECIINNEVKNVSPAVDNIIDTSDLLEDGIPTAVEVSKKHDPSKNVDGDVDVSNNEEITVTSNVTDVVVEEVALENANSLAVVNRKTNSSDNGKKLIQAFDVMKMHKNFDERTGNLFGIILKLKDKGLKMREEYSVTDNPLFGERLNSLSLKLVQKEKEVASVKKQNKDLEASLKEVKREKVQHDKDLKEKEKESVKKDEVITDLKNQLEMRQLEKHNGVDGSAAVTKYQEINDQLSALQEELDRKNGELEVLAQSHSDVVERCKSLMHENSQLNDKVIVLEAVNGQLDESVHNEVVVVHAKNPEVSLDSSKELESLKKKIDKVNKENSLLKDQVTSKSNELDKVDSFYKEILDGKDEEINSLLSITKSNTEVEKNYKRLLLKFRSEQELKLIRDLKSDIEHKVNQLNLGKEKAGGNDDVVMQEENTSPKNNEALVHVDKDKVVEKQDPVRAPEIPDEGRKKRMCKSGRNCDIKSTCTYSHEIVNKPCRFGDRCNKKAACLFLHEHFLDHCGITGAGDRRKWGEFEEVNNSRGYINDPFGMSRPNCGGMPNLGIQNYQGFGSMPRGVGVSGQPNFGGVPSRMVSHASGYARHSEDSSRFRNGNGFGQVLTMDDNNRCPLVGGATNKLCRDGGKCSSMNTCQFSHKMIQKDCRYGNECKWVDKCLFQHHGRNLQCGNVNGDNPTAHPGSKN